MGVWLLVAVGVWCVLCGEAKLNKELAARPLMGFSTYNAFFRVYNETMLEENADLMVQLGLVELGYNYFNVDGMWWNHRDWVVLRNESGHWVEPTDKFPSGVTAFSEYIHSRGFKLGWYTSGRNTACCCSPNFMMPMSGAGIGSEGSYEFQDMERLKEWGVDYLKIDNCSGRNRPTERARNVLQLWNDLAEGTDIVIENCRLSCMAKTTSKGSLVDASKQKLDSWCSKVAHLSRISRDIGAYKDGSVISGTRSPSWESILHNANAVRGLEDHSGPGHWLHMDTLDVGNPGLTLEENKSHFALWAICSSPLYIGVDLRKVLTEHLAIFKNEKAIRVNQLYENDPGHFIEEKKDVQLWAKRLPDNELAVLALNLHNRNQKTYTFDFSNSQRWVKDLVNHIIPAGFDEAKDTLSCEIDDIWAGKTTIVEDSLTVELSVHEGAFLVIKECEITTILPPSRSPISEPTEEPEVPAPERPAACLIYNPKCKTYRGKRKCEKKGCQWCKTFTNANGKATCRTKLTHQCFYSDIFDHCEEFL